MYLYKFKVDKKLRILPLGNESELPADTSGGGGRTQYYKLWRRILLDSKDAIELVISDGKSFRLLDYQDICFCGVVWVDIYVDPVRSLNSLITGAEVIIEARPDCLLSKQLDDSKTLIDIGKASAGLAHGVRSPLNAIKGSIVYLQGRYASDPAFLEFSRIIEDEISKLDKYISKFLSGSPCRAKATDISISPLLDKIVKIAGMQAESKKIAFLRDERDLPSIKTDPFQLEHAILNIINNAIESIHDSGCITIRTCLTELTGTEHVTIEISDSGRGFENKDHAHELKKDPNAKGRGFGLFITHEIAKNLGGLLEITSRKNVGTTVKIHIPKALPWGE